jgi:hypothetical protein
LLYFTIQAQRLDSIKKSNSLQLFFAIQAAVVESRRQQDEETEVGDIFEGSGESDRSIGSVSNSRFIIFQNLNQCSGTGTGTVVIITF